MQRIVFIATSILLSMGVLHAQSVTSSRSAGLLDIAVTYTADRTLKASTTQTSWIQGGSIELGASVWRGFGFAAAVQGAHTGSIGSSGIPFSNVTVVFGPRYRWHQGRRISAYGEGLIGESDGFHSLFPGVSSAGSSADTLATVVGGGMDYRVSEHFAIRLVNAGWLHTQFPNATDNRQNDLQLGAGTVWRFGH